MINRNDMPLITKEETEKALDFCVKQIKRCLKDFDNGFVSTTSRNNFYRQVKNEGWTGGFWTGEVWLGFEHSGDESLKKAALYQVDTFLNRIIKRIKVDYHDMGFLYSLSCVAAYKLVGSEEGKKAALMAAENLANRFQPVGQFIQAWGDMGDPDQYRLIIDCLLNLPLLYWASEETGDAHFKDVAQKHIHTTMNCIFREDYSTYHTYFFDPKTGEPLYGSAHQAYCNGSAWARGQAWGIYGCALAYKYTKEEKYKEIFCRVCDYFISRLPKDMVSFWDLIFSDGDGEPRDTSAAATACCGMLEMAEHLDGELAEKYTKTAKQIMKSLYDNYAVKDLEKSNGMLLHGVYAKKSPYNTCESCDGVDECTLFGDYFYMEALTRLNKKWNPYW